MKKGNSNVRPIYSNIMLPRYLIFSGNKISVYMRDDADDSDDLSDAQIVLEQVWMG